MHVFEIDHPVTAQDKAKRLQSTGIQIPKNAHQISADFNQDTYTDKAGERAKKQTMLAGGAHEAMLASYSYPEVEKLLERHGFLIYEHLTPPEITEKWFVQYNQENPQNPIFAFDNVNYCLAVKR